MPLSVAPQGLGRTSQGTYFRLPAKNKQKTRTLRYVVAFNKIYEKEKEISKLLLDGKYLEHCSETKNQSERNVTYLGQESRAFFENTWN